jgi:hypothetical protein
VLSFETMWARRTLVLAALLADLLVCAAVPAVAQAAPFDPSGQEPPPASLEVSAHEPTESPDRLPPDAPPPPDAPTADLHAREDAILLGTLLAGNAGFAASSTFGGLAYAGTGTVFVVSSVTYLARGGDVLPALGPMLFGVGGLGLGAYQLAQGGDLARLQFDFYRAAQASSPPRALVSIFEPRLAAASARAHARRRAFGLGLVALGIATTAAAIYTTAQPVDRLDGATLPTVLFGAATIDLLAAATLLTYESPAEVAWLTYVRGTTR